MSLECCEECDKMIDLDTDQEHEHFYKLSKITDADGVTPKLPKLKDVKTFFSEMKPSLNNDSAKLKTLKDLDKYMIKGNVMKKSKELGKWFFWKDLRQEAIKWIKHYSWEMDKQVHKVLMQFFNITEEDLK